MKIDVINSKFINILSLDTDIFKLQCEKINFDFVEFETVKIS